MAPSAKVSIVAERLAVAYRYFPSGESSGELDTVEDVAAGRYLAAGVARSLLLRQAEKVSAPLAGSRSNVVRVSSSPAVT